MRVHWLRDKKDKTKKALYPQKEEIKAFCELHNLDYHWARSPHSYWCIEDINDTKEKEIGEFALQKFNITDYKTTERRNDVIAKKKIEGLLYYENMKPMYMLRERAELEEKVSNINAIYGTSYDLEEFCK
jgi:hypothetical protein